MSRPLLAKVVLAVRGITNHQLAAELGCSECWISLVLNGHRTPSRAFRRHLARLLDLPEARLFGPPNLAQAARAQNDADHAAGLPCRCVEDPAVLYRVTALLLDGQQGSVPGSTKSHHLRRNPCETRVARPAGAGRVPCRQCGGAVV